MGKTNSLFKSLQTASMSVRRLEIGGGGCYSNHQDSQTRNLSTNFPTCHFPAITPEVAKRLFTEKTAEDLPVPNMEIPQIIRVKILKMPACRGKHGNTRPHPEYVRLGGWVGVGGGLRGFPRPLILPNNCEGATAATRRGRGQLPKAALTGWGGRKEIKL